MIIVKRKDKEGNVYFENQQMDDSMNIVLKEISFDRIFEAMFDKSIVFEFDYTSAVG